MKMRAELIWLLLCVAARPNLLPAQELPESLPVTSALSNSGEPRKRLEREIAEAEMALGRLAQSAETQPRETANATSALADLYLKAGDYERASGLIEQALEIRRTRFGDEDRDTAASFQQLAEFREELGAFAEAETLYRQALGVRRQADSGSIETAAALHGLGRLLSKMGNFAEAGQLLREALAIRERKLSAQDVEIAYTLYELAKIEACKGNDSEAHILGGKAYDIFKAALGAKHPDTEDARIVMEAFGEAVAEKAFGFGMQIGHIPGGPSPEAQTGKTEDQLGRRRFFLTGPYNAQEAEKLSDAAEVLERSANADDREQALLMQERSLRMRERVLGPEHPLTLQSLQRLGLAALEQHEYDRALLIARKAMFAQTRHLQRVFSFTDEEQRLAFEATMSPFSVFASLREVPVNDLATAMLRFKGAVLDSLLTERREADASQDPSLRPLLARVASAREAWRRLEANAIASGKDDFDAINTQRAALETEFQEIERDFAQAGFGAGGLAASTTTRQIISALSPDILLVEVIRYAHYLTGTRSEERYGAILLTTATDPVWVPLGLAADLEKLVANYQESVASHQKAASGDTGGYRLETDLRELYDWFWLPIERALPRRYPRVIISPDGALNFVSFATLLAPDRRFLAEKVAISYVATGRDILAEQPARSGKMLVVCAAPNYLDLPSAPESHNASEPMRPVERDAYRGLQLNSLPGADREAAALREKAAAWGWEVMTLEGSDALESRLRQIKSPRVLHLATHGLFVVEGKVATARDELMNPMRLVGLALCGAQRTLDLWEKSEVPPADNDGILTAEDVSTIDLKGTWLVTLSACNTGRGEAKAGEGVLGLRRGFVQAGVQNLLMTLWSISDRRDTVEIMSDFYEAAHKGGNPAQALADVQRDWLVKNRNKYSLARAVYQVGAFIISSQGKP
jgi:CHAT domain-containing protein/tetratricopeptide (TPR) repeat protein